ncbi:MAG: hypothetical protein AB7E49_09415 [Campylobacterales bacterium]
MASNELQGELATMKKLLELLERELSEMSAKEEEILYLLEQNSGDSATQDLMSETKKLRENIAKLLDKQG